MTHTALLIALLLAAPQAAEEKADEVLVLQGGILHVGDGRQLSGVTVIIRNGKIEAVGEEFEPPDGAPVVKVPMTYHITPGFIDLHSHLGMTTELDETPRAITPLMRAADGFSTDRDDVRRARASGVTSVALSPGGGNIVGGAMSVVRLGEGYLHEVLVEPVAAMKLSLGRAALRRGREPTSLAGAVTLLEQELADTNSETHKRLVKEKRRAFIHVDTVEEIARALKLKSAFGLRLVLLHAAAADEMVEAIRAADVPVVLGPLTLTDDARTLRRAGVLSRAGISVGFASDSPRTSEEQLRMTAILAVRHGMSKEKALKGLSSVAAGLLGMEDRLGTVERGRDADLVIYTGHPLSPTARVDRVVVGGRIVHGRDSE